MAVTTLVYVNGYEALAGISNIYLFHISYLQIAHQQVSGLYLEMWIALSFWKSLGHFQLSWIGLSYQFPTDFKQRVW